MLWKTRAQFVFGSLCLSAAVPAVPLMAQSGAAQAVSFTDASALEAHHIKVEAVDYLGRKAIKLTTGTMEDASGFALLPGVDFQDGTIEADLAVKITTPPGVRMPGFSGIGFRSKRDGSEYELLYLRPKNARADDQAMRNHAVQYTAEPHHDWYRLRREWPFIYESYATIGPERWINVKIQVAGRSARLFLDGAEQPSLVVDGLKTSNLHGAVALWGYAGEESYFSKIRVTPAVAAPIKNGSDAVGSWELKASTDVGPFSGTLHLTRDGKQLTGTWSGDLGKDEPVAGTWREGYIELSFPAEWPDGPQGKPGPTTAVLDGWVDDNAAKGRIRVEGRTMGQWMAQRSAP
ncbi:MAG TPA: hypothetical protein VHZ28_10725 [Terracidiphilus sp.]|nr:hypothetical protein [Terracidiphilus sp.]